MKGTFIEKALSPFMHLFWKTQIGILRACPPMYGIVCNAGLSAANSRRVWVKSFFMLALKAPGALLQNWRNKWKKRVVLSRVSISVTTRCTLNCDKCIAHIPDLNRHRNMPLSEITQDIQALFSCVDHIYAVIISGGEAFLHPNLDEIVKICADTGKAGHISIQSNGTVIPGAKVLAALREANATVKISRYSPELQPEVETLKQILKANSVHYTHESSAFWRDISGFGQLQAGSAKRRFSICVEQLSVPYYYGKLHLCCESAILMKEGRIPEHESDYVDLRTIHPADFREQWQRLLRKRSVFACAYCAGNTYRSARVSVAVQRETLKEGSGSV